MPPVSWIPTAFGNCSSMADAASSADLVAFYASVDRAVSALEARHREQLHCGHGCSACCVDDLTVFAVEADRIRREAAEVLLQAPGPSGMCAFLDAAGGCRIYAVRPYVCRTQGLPLRWLEDDEADEEAPAEYRDICPLNEEDIDLVALDEDACWTIGPHEGMLAEHQRDTHQGRMTRVALRDLFQAPAPSADLS